MRVRAVRRHAPDSKFWGALGAAWSLGRRSAQVRHGNCPLVIGVPADLAAAMVPKTARDRIAILVPNLRNTRISSAAASGDFTTCRPQLRRLCRSARTG